MRVPIAGGLPGVPEPPIDIEEPGQLLEFLCARGILAPGEEAAVRALPGGVSNRTVLVESAGRAPFVVKQALSKLRVAVEWRADPERIHREARALEYLSRLAPGAVPRLLFEDRQQHAIGMTAVPQPHRNWKELLLEGSVNLRDLETQMQWSLPRDGGVETLAGFVLMRLGHIPRGGEWVVHEGRKMTVTEMDGRRIAKVRVEPVEEEREAGLAI